METVTGERIQPGSLGETVLSKVYRTSKRARSDFLERKAEGYISATVDRGGRNIPRGGVREGEASSEWTEQNAVASCMRQV